jgi:hypothetical protein
MMAFQLPLVRHARSHRKYRRRLSPVANRQHQRLLVAQNNRGNQHAIGGKYAGYESDFTIRSDIERFSVTTAGESGTVPAGDAADLK